jgi:hypothetical protein
MVHSRTFSVLFALIFALVSGLSLSSCSKDKDPTPTASSFSATQLVGSWQLDEITRNKQTYSSGTTIKDRFRLTFKADGTYTQVLMADNTTYAGTWMVMGTNNSLLHLTDHKGDPQEYTLTALSAQQLRYSRVNGSVAGSPTEEFIFSAQQ